MRQGAELYAADPTLTGGPTDRTRELDLLSELARQIIALVRSAATGAAASRWPVENRWADPRTAVF
ncbi:hypothetical protein HS041_36040 [Planomonospora sp. ID67723]|uniref:hypothetical protein n=1 Tax=Planomonospora sp. ID67723 TaxID=2738134 RepID=UPI0018C3D8C8|nr:hypothetical protein [Planomonospora sp. ID67723]MBG0833118.1 hypothetical protein [Planomonospora sp. ID67723]